LISRYRAILDSPNVFVGVLLVLAMDAAIKWIERKAAIWADRHPRRTERHGRNRAHCPAAAT
jgi:hypothetical protein